MFKKPEPAREILNPFCYGPHLATLGDFSKSDEWETSGGDAWVKEHDIQYKKMN